MLTAEILANNATNSTDRMSQSPSHMLRLILRYFVRNECEELTPHQFYIRVTKHFR